MNDIGFSAIDFTARTITYEGDARTIRHTTYEGPTAHGKLYMPDATELAFDTPLTADERETLVALLTTIGARVRSNMLATTGATVRLHPVCRECGAQLPDNAAFCITCRAPAHL